VPPTTAREVLDRTATCLVACRGRPGPLLAPTTSWFDGEGIWTTTASNAALVSTLRRDQRCAVYVPAVTSAPGLVGEGDVRVYGVFDPVGLATHALSISAALAALAARNAGALLGYLHEAARIPPGWLPRNRVVMRILLGAVRLLPPVVIDEAGVIPALPTGVPLDVRRALSGHRLVALATEDGPRLEVGPAVWSGEFVLTPPVTRRLVPGTAATVTLHRDPDGRPSSAAGLSLSGELVAGGRLSPTRATWWHGFDQGEAPITATPAAIVLPD
jgi:hypothetical protein